jgi:hypothetical protein
MRKESDRLCREYELSVIDHPQRGKSRHYAEWKADQEDKPTWRGLIRTDVDNAIRASMTFTQFLSELRKMGYEIKTGVKHLAMRPPGKEWFVRLRSLGDEYTEEAIKQRILQNRSPPKRQEALPKSKRVRGFVRGSIRSTRKLTGLQALYLHYLYKMGILPHNRASPKRTHFLLREDLRHLDEIIAQTKLLCVHKVVNMEQLSLYKAGLEAQIITLSDARKSEYNRIRRRGNEDQIDGHKRRIAELSRQIKALRKEVSLCAGILARTDAMKNTLEQVKQEENNKRKEEQTHEQQRSNRSGRQHDFKGH